MSNWFLPNVSLQSVHKLCGPLRKCDIYFWTVYVFKIVLWTLKSFCGPFLKYLEGVKEVKEAFNEIIYIEAFLIKYGSKKDRLTVLQEKTWLHVCMTDWLTTDWLTDSVMCYSRRHFAWICMESPGENMFTYSHWALSNCHPIKSIGKLWSIMHEVNGGNNCFAITTNDH